MTWFTCTTTQGLKVTKNETEFPPCDDDAIVSKNNGDLIVKSLSVKYIKYHSAVY